MSNVVHFLICEMYEIAYKLNIVTIHSKTFPYTHFCNYGE